MNIVRALSFVLILVTPLAKTFAKPIQLTTDLKTTAQAIKTWTDNDFKAETCAMRTASDFYTPLATYLYTGKAQTRYSKEQLTGLSATESQDTLTTLFEARQNLRDRFRKMTIENKFRSRDEFLNCANEVRVAMRTIRSWEEQFALYWAKQNGKAQDKLADTDLSRYALGWPQWMAHPKYKAQFKGLESLQDGDLLLSRGDSFTSAVISRIGAVDNQFSHIAMVYVDDGTIMGQRNKKYVIESVLNAGLKIIPLEEYMSHHKARWAIFRYKNVTGKNSSPEKEILRRASRYLAEKAKTGKVCYNFTMDMHDPECMFCSQAISQAIDHACSSEGISCESFPAYRNPSLFSFPLAYTRFQPEQNPLMRLLNMTVSETFSPADVEVDPRLDFVAEFRNLGYIEQARMYDMIFTKMFQWMETGRYNFADSAVVLTFTKIGDEFVKEMGRMPANTPEAFTQGSLLLFFLVEYLGPGERWGNILEGLDNGRVEAGVKELTSRGLLTPEKARYVLENKDRVIARVARHVGFKAHIERLAKAYERRFGQPIPEYDMDKAMELIRVEDCGRVQRSESPLFHDLFAVQFDGAPSLRCPMAPFDRGIFP